MIRQRRWCDKAGIVQFAKKKNLRYLGAVGAVWRDKTLETRDKTLLQAYSITAAGSRQQAAGSRQLPESLKSFFSARPHPTKTADPMAPTAPA